MNKMGLIMAVFGLIVTGYAAIADNTGNFGMWKTAYIGAPLSGAINWIEAKGKLSASGPCKLDPAWTPYFSYFYKENIGLKDYTARFIINKNRCQRPFGFAVRFQDINNHYLFYVSNFEEIEFHRVVNGKHETVTSVRGYIPFGVDNYIELNVRGDTYAMLINGEPLLAAQDSKFSGGGFGFMASESGKYTIHNFKLFEKAPPVESIKPVLLKPVYPLWVDGTSAILMWETNIQLPSRIEYGMAPDALKQSKSDSAPARLHQIRIDNLEKGTKYYYKVFSGDLSCGQGSFLTAPEPGTPFSFGVIGDTQSGMDKAVRMNRFMAKRSPALVISPGDIVETGCVADEWDSNHFRPFRDIYEIAPCYVALGGHELILPRKGKGAPLFFRNEAYWFTTYLPYPGTGPESHSYALSYGDVRFIIIDNAYNYPFPESDLYQKYWKRQCDWLLKELESDDFKKARWHVLVYHEPPYICGWKSIRTGGFPRARKDLLPLMEKYKIDVALYGHVHSYERGYLNGVLHVVSGGGGSGGEDYGRNQFHVQKFLLEPHYCMFDVTPSSLKMSVYNLDNKLVDTVMLEKGKKWELSASPVIIKPAQNGVVGEQEIVVSCPALKNSRLCWRVALAEQREQDSFWEPSKEAWDGGSEVRLKIKFPEPGFYTVKVQALDENLRPTRWVDAGKVEIKKLNTN